MKKIFFFFLLISSSILAQNEVKVDLTNPKATIYTHLYFLQADSYEPSKAALTILGVSKKEAIAKAIKIKEVLDGKGLKVDMNKVPTDKNYLDTIAGITGGSIIETNHRFIPFPEKMPEIYVEKVGSKWYYSKETIKSIDNIYKETFPWEFKWLQKKFPALFEKQIEGVNIWKPFAILILIGFCILLVHALKRILFYILKKSQNLFIKNKSYENSFELLREIARIIALLLMLVIVDKILPSLQLYKINNFLFLAIDIAETVFVVFLIIKIIKLALLYYSDFSNKTHSKLDEQLAPILNKLMLGIVVFIGFLHILTLLGVDPTTVLAGASIGGVAVAFAAQDSVKNFIGTVNIFLDKPFRLGDWVVIGGVEGTVEHVGLRSTQVRAADTSIFQIPNGKVSDMEINNKGLRIYRRYNTELGIRYDTPPELIEAFVQGIRKIIIEHPDTRSESYNVEFTSFGDSALKILVNVFFKHLDWGSEQSSKHRLHIAIVKLASALGIGFAFPSSTLMIEQLPGQESLATKYNTNVKDIENSINSVIKEFEEMDHRVDKNASSLPE